MDEDFSDFMKEDDDDKEVEEEGPDEEEVEQKPVHVPNGSEAKGEQNDIQNISVTATQ